MRPRLLLTINCKFAVDFFARGLHTRTAVARLPLRQLGFLVLIALLLTVGLSRNITLYTSTHITEVLLTSLTSRAYQTVCNKRRPVPLPQGCCWWWWSPWWWHHLLMIDMTHRRRCRRSAGDERICRPGRFLCCCGSIATWTLIVFSTTTRCRRERERAHCLSTMLWVTLVRFRTR